MIGYAEMLLGHGFSVLRPTLGRTEPAAANLPPTVCSNRRTFTLGLIGSRKNQHPGCIFGFAESIGAHSSCNRCKPNRTFALLLRNRLFQSFREIAYDLVGQNSSMLARARGTILRPVFEGRIRYC